MLEGIILLGAALYQCRDEIYQCNHAVSISQKHCSYVTLFVFEPAHNKTCNKTSVTSKDSDQLVHPPSNTRIFVYPSLDSHEAVEGTRDQ